MFEGVVLSILERVLGQCAPPKLMPLLVPSPHA